MANVERRRRQRLEVGRERMLLYAVHHTLQSLGFISDATIYRVIQIISKQARVSRAWKSAYVLISVTIAGSLEPHFYRVCNISMTLQSRSCGKTAMEWGGYRNQWDKTIWCQGKHQFPSPSLRLYEGKTFSFSRTLKHDTTHNCKGVTTCPTML